jgi:hypothetical protein
MMRFFRNNLFPIVATAVVVVGTIFAVGRNRVAVEDGAAAAEPNSNNTDDKKTKKNGDEGTKKDGAPKETRKTKHDISLDQAPVLVAYGSQTGNAKAIAQEVYEKLGRREIQANLSELNDWKKVRSQLQDAIPFCNKHTYAQTVSLPSAIFSNTHMSYSLLYFKVEILSAKHQVRFVCHLNHW